MFNNQFKPLKQVLSISLKYSQVKSFPFVYYHIFDLLASVTSQLILNIFAYCSFWCKSCVFLFIAAYRLVLQLSISHVLQSSQVTYRYTRLHVRMKLEKHLIFKNSKIIYLKGKNNSSELETQHMNWLINIYLVIVFRNFLHQSCMGYSVFQ